MMKAVSHRARLLGPAALLALTTRCGSGSSEHTQASAGIDDATAMPSNAAADDRVEPSSVEPASDPVAVEGATLRFVALNTGGGLCRDANGNPSDTECSYSVRVEGVTLTYRSVSGEQSVFELSPEQQTAVAALGAETTLRAAVEAFSPADCASNPDGSTRLDIAWSDSEPYALAPVATCIAEGSTHPLRPIAAKVWELKLEYVGLEL